jgi:hypothetical protein
VFAFEDDNFAACTSNIGADVKSLPQMVNQTMTGHDTDFKKNADVRLKNGA